MKKSIQIRSLVTILFISFINSSCIKGVDFEQAESIILKPITEFSLIYTSLDAPDFLDEFGLEFPSITDSVILEVLSDDFLEYQNLAKSQSVSLQLGFNYIFKNNDN